MISRASNLIKASTSLLNGTSFVILRYSSRSQYRFLNTDSKFIPQHENLNDHKITPVSNPSFLDSDLKTLDLNKNDNTLANTISKITSILNNIIIPSGHTVLKKVSKHYRVDDPEYVQNDDEDKSKNSNSNKLLEIENLTLPTSTPAEQIEEVIKQIKLNNLESNYQIMILLLEAQISIRNLSDALKTLHVFSENSMIPNTGTLETLAKVIDLFIMNNASQNQLGKN
ncbi:hypothetical protein AYI68_g703 [Smittium mucronatum]|uniref:Uncharacterized protein n=1 Tax=Smittium mucronatum TaxID=133383 RepID=A0A1R0H7L7_9FUNG|nr:hypothetical protein AYI68_g703 [Smittium mucronatum]